MNVKNRRTYEELIHSPSLFLPLCYGIYRVCNTTSRSKIQRNENSVMLHRTVLFPASRNEDDCGDDKRAAWLFPSRRFSYQIWHLLLPSSFSENDTLFFSRPSANCRILLSNHAREVRGYLCWGGRRLKISPDRKFFWKVVSLTMQVPR